MLQGLIPKAAVVTTVVEAANEEGEHLQVLDTPCMSKGVALLVQCEKELCGSRDMRPFPADLFLHTHLFLILYFGPEVLLLSKALACTI